MADQARVNSLAGLAVGDQVRRRYYRHERVGEVVALLPAGVNLAGRVVPNCVMVRWSNRITRVKLCELERVK